MSKVRQYLFGVNVTEDHPEFSDEQLQEFADGLKEHVASKLEDGFNGISSWTYSKDANLSEEEEFED